MGAALVALLNLAFITAPTQNLHIMQHCNLPITPFRSVQRNRLGQSCHDLSLWQWLACRSAVKSGDDMPSRPGDWLSKEA